MNETRGLSDNELRLATSRSLPADAKLSAGANAARAAFLSLGAGLAEAGGSFDDTALISQLRRTCQGAGDADSPSVAASRPTFWWAAVLGGALAASVLILLARFGGTLPSGSAIVAQPQAAASGAANKRKAAVPAALAQGGRGESAPAAWGDGWTDPLDDQIAHVSARIGGMSHKSRGVDGSLWEVGDRLETLSQELLSESL